MARRASPDNPPCPRCGGKHGTKNGHKDGRQRWLCPDCGGTFGATYGTARDRLRTSAAEIGRTLLVVMRRGSLSAAEEITGHKDETIGRWVPLAAEQAEVITQALVPDLHLTGVEVDAFWSFVKKSVASLEARQARRRGWARAGDA